MQKAFHKRLRSKPMMFETGFIGGKQPPAEERIFEHPREKTTQNSQEAGQNNNMQTWYDFTQNTTIHGVKYIFDKSHIKVRR